MIASKHIPFLSSPCIIPFLINTTSFPTSSFFLSLFSFNPKSNLSLYSPFSSMADGVTVPPLKSPKRPSKQNPPPPATNFHSRFIFKALIAFFFFIIVPVFPSIAPEFFNQNFFSQSWELLHIVFVGIAVSYGLFSRRYDDSGGENHQKADTTHSYVSKLLQVSSVFDDDVDSPSGSSSSSSFDDGGNKVQTWSSQYFRNEPVVVVANKEQGGSVIGDDHKPLLLPVRSLKSRVSDENAGGNDSRVSGRSYTRSRSYTSGSAPKEPLNWEKKIGNGNMKSRASDFSGISESDPNPSLDETPTRIEEATAVLPSPIPWRSRSDRMEKNEDDPPMEQMDPNPSGWSQLSSKSSPMKAFPAPACLFETQSKRTEDSTRRKTVYRPPPPPPPPPPVAFYNKSPLIKSKTTMVNHGNEAPSWDDSSSLWNEPKSRRTIRSPRNWKEADAEEEPIVPQKPDELNHDENSFLDYTNENGDDFLAEVHAMSDDEDEDDESGNEADEHHVANAENGVEDNAIAAIAGAVVAGAGADVVAGTCSIGVDDEGPDVDKKADEFIAKFREQIRLQRIESIKRSTGQFSRSSVK